MIINTRGFGPVDSGLPDLVKIEGHNPEWIKTAELAKRSDLLCNYCSDALTRMDMAIHDSDLEAIKDAREKLWVVQMILLKNACEGEHDD